MWFDKNSEPGQMTYWTRVYLNKYMNLEKLLVYGYEKSLGLAFINKNAKEWGFKHIFLLPNSINMLKTLNNQQKQTCLNHCKSNINR